jgi:hypothetical protein
MYCNSMTLTLSMPCLAVKYCRSWCSDHLQPFSGS